MRQLEERAVDPEVIRLLWSPKMDVLAVANVSGEVTLYRLNWQKVWTRRPPADNLQCLSLAWRPDGKVLAVGYGMGRLVLIDVERNSVVHSVSYPSSPAVTALNWVQCGDDRASASPSNVPGQGGAVGGHQPMNGGKASK